MPTPDDDLANFEEARRRIAEAKANGSDILYLGDLNLEILPDELAELTELRALGLGKAAPCRDQNSVVVWEYAHKAGELRIEKIDLLANLTALRSLDLSGCRRIRNISPLSGLTALQSLDLSGCFIIRDISPISGLTALQSLKLVVFDLRDITVLGGLEALQSLDLDHCEMIDASPLSGLKSLKTLSLRYCKKLSDISPLSGLMKLQSVDLSGCKNLSDISPLSVLMALQSVDLRRCDNLSDIAPLSGLHSLQSLNLSGCNNLSDITLLSGLNALQSLDLSDCNNLNDISPLLKLDKLRVLWISKCQSLHEFTPVRGLLPQLIVLSIFGCPWIDLPKEVCGEYSFDNVVDKVRAHFADLDAGGVLDAELKVCVLGNGGVGKTQLCRRLRDEPFDRNIPSTHGIELGHWYIDLPQFSTEPVRLNLWDFGGQDIYLGSHALFLQGPAIFVILWNPDSEQGELIENGLSIHNRPLAYWLDYVRNLAGVEVPIIVVQSKCDGIEDRCIPPEGLSKLQMVRTLEFSAFTDLGLDLVKASIKEAAREMIASRPLQKIGVGRVKVRNQLRKWLEDEQDLPSIKKKHRTVSVRQFHDLCRRPRASSNSGLFLTWLSSYLPSMFQRSKGVSDPNALLDYLHHCGVVIYRPHLFNNQIILDQTWALEAVYAVFHRQRSAPFIQRAGGRFTRTDLARHIWQKYSEAEQDLFLSMMQSCGICFPIRKVPRPDATERDEWDREEWEYIAAELLPEWNNVQELLLGRLRSEPAAVVATAEFDFLHEGVLRGLLSKIGEIAGDAAIYWKYGCWFVDEITNCPVFIDAHLSTDEVSGQGSIQFNSWDRPAMIVIEKLLKLLDAQPISAKMRVSRSWDDRLGCEAKEFESQLSYQSSESIMRMPENENTEAFCHSGTFTPAVKRPAAAIADANATTETPVFTVKQHPEIEHKGAPDIFISFAWGEDESDAGRLRTKAVDTLEAKLQNWGYNPLVDRNQLRSGDLISNFMRRIGRGDHVLVILSEKYLRSPYSMTELHYIYQRSLGEKEEFLKRIIPVVLPDAKIDNWRDRKNHAEHWRQEYEEMEASFKDLGTDDRNTSHLIRHWHLDIGNMLSFISDMRSLRTWDAISEDDFAAVRDMLPKVIA